MKKIIMVAAALVSVGCSSGMWRPPYMSNERHVWEFSRLYKETESEVQIEFATSAAEESNKSDKVLSDENFEYDLGNVGKAVIKCKNNNATIVDLNNFLWATCWSKYLLEKLDNLPKEGVMLLDVWIHAQCYVGAALAMTMACDVLQDSAEFEVDNMPARKLFENFKNSNTGIRHPMRRWSEIYRNIDHDTIVEILGLCLDGSNGMQFKCLDDSEGRGTDAITIRTSKYIVTENNVDIGIKWRGNRDMLLPYMNEMYKAISSLKGMRSTGSAVASTREACERIVGPMITCYKKVTRNLNVMLYDFPFCLETYRAYGELKRCKWAPKYKNILDDDEKMKDVLRGYCQAISGTEMLCCICTPHAASCYSELIKFFKGEQWERKFKDFVNESKLYKLTPETDDDGKQHNKLEKW